MHGHLDYSLIQNVARSHAPVWDCDLNTILYHFMMIHIVYLQEYVLFICEKKLWKVMMSTEYKPITFHAVP